jgi:hypothetical protein
VDASQLLLFQLTILRWIVYVGYTSIATTKSKLTMLARNVCFVVGTYEQLVLGYTVGKINEARKNERVFHH